MNKVLCIAVLVACGASGSGVATAQDNPAPAVQPAGSAAPGVKEKFKADAKETGEAIKRDAKSVGQATARDAKAVGDVAKRDAKIVADKTKQQAKAAGKAVKKVAKTTTDATKTEVDKLKKSPPTTQTPTESK